jgi:hypothetical protein
MKRFEQGFDWHASVLGIGNIMKVIQNEPTDCRCTALLIGVIKVQKGTQNTVGVSLLAMANCLSRMRQPANRNGEQAQGIG